MNSKSYSLFLKDFKSELRTRYAINALAMFIIVAISVIMFSVGQEKISKSLTGGLFWGRARYFLNFTINCSTVNRFFWKTNI